MKKKAKPEEIAENVQTPALVTVAVFDAQGIYIKTEAIPASEVTEEHIQCPSGCDLPPGKYYWHPKLKCFWPLAKERKGTV